MNDDELLRRLTDAFAPEPCTPPTTGLQALHQTIDVARNTRPSGRRLRRRWLLPAVATVSALGIGNLALAAAGTTLPRVLRAAAHEVHLPVDSPALLDTRHHFNALSAALDRDDRAAIDEQMRLLRTSSNRLDADERGQIAGEVLEILGRAQTRLAPPNDDPTPSAAPTTTPRATTPEVTPEPVASKQTDDPDDTDAISDGKGPATSTGYAPTDTLGDRGTTNSIDGQGNEKAHAGNDGQSIDNQPTDIGSRSEKSTQSDVASDASPGGEG